MYGGAWKKGEVVKGRTYNIRFYYKVLRVMEGKRFAVKGSRPIIMLKVGLGLFNGI